MNPYATIASTIAPPKPNRMPISWPIEGGGVKGGAFTVDMLKWEIDN